MTPRATPSCDALAALGSDAWAQVLVAAKQLASRRTDEQDPELVTLAGLSTSRLVGGKARRRLERLLASADRWPAVVAELPGDGAITPELQALLDRPVDPAEPGGGGRAVIDAQDQRRPSAGADDPSASAKARAREARASRDRWQRRAEGAQARVTTLQQQLEARDRELDQLRGRLAAVEEQLEASAADGVRAVEREGRRREAELARLRAELAALRRQDEERRIDHRRRTERRQQLAADERRRHLAVRGAEEQPDTRLVPGRPSTLPPGVVAGTTEAARALLHAGRRTIVDGYNVTLQHQAHLELEQQRNWLVGQLGNLVARRRVTVTVVFDGERSGGGRPATGARGVLVRFTGSGITADDEIVLDVEATDEPVTVVTDDRELVARVAASGADVIGTRALLGVIA